MPPQDLLRLVLCWVGDQLKALGLDCPRQRGPGLPGRLEVRHGATAWASK
jgi:hypothetical protein